ncbi:hypothetical protein KR227_09165 [Corynebacterium sp. TAE3-ERU30]|nr:hypothetical protein [Corynebacterium sp. TAE3-ERU30]
MVMSTAPVYAGPRCPDTFQYLDTAPTSTRSGEQLPADWGEAVVHCVVMAGARATGKSLYLAVVVKQLELLANEKFPGMVVEPATASTKERYAKYYEQPLYVEMKQMAPTPTSSQEDAYQRDPFIFSLGTWPDRDGVERPNYVVLRDVAGEDLENPRVDRKALSFFRDADLVIMLFDPLRVHSVQAYVQGLVPRQDGLGGDPEDVFTNLMRILGDARPPLALAISKFDSLQILERMPDGDWKAIMGNRGAAFRRDNGWDYNPEAQKVLNLEVKSLLGYMNAGGLLNKVEAAYMDSVHSYFAVSSLGDSPMGERLSRKGIAPYRCLDPLLWILTQRNVLKED